MRIDHQLVHILKTVEHGLRRHFSADWLVINGCATHVDEVVEQLQRHVAQIERAEQAFAIWFDEVTSLLAAIRAEVRPLLAGLHTFLVEELGADSPRLRDFGFRPGAAIDATQEG